jgi:hypothetical protein
MEHAGAVPLCHRGSRGRKPPSGSAQAIAWAARKPTAAMVFQRPGPCIAPPVFGIAPPSLPVCLLSRPHDGLGEASFSSQFLPKFYYVKRRFSITSKIQTNAWSIKCR